MDFKIENIYSIRVYRIENIFELRISICLFVKNLILLESIVNL